MSKEKTYSNGEVTVIWKPDVCIHSEKCWRGLPGVFKPREKPWIQPEGAETEAIVRQIQQCPSGALSYRMNEGYTDPTATADAEEAAISVEALANGPLMVKGTLKVRKSNGEEEIRTRSTSFCRCGASGNKPFCDGSHKRVGFEG